MKYIIILSLCLLSYIGCNSGKVEYLRNKNFFKVASIDTSTFTDYNFIILENENDIFSLITKKEELRDNDSTYFILDTLKKNKFYELSIEHNDSLTDLNLKNKLYPIQAYAYNKQILWEKDTLIVPAFNSKDVVGIFLVKKKVNF